MRQKQAQRLIAVTASFIILALSWGAGMIIRLFPALFLVKVRDISLFVGVTILAVLILEYFISNQILHGFSYFWEYRKIKNRLEKQMLDAGYGIQRSYYVELPKVRLSFNDNLTSGQLRLKNTIKFDKKLDDVLLSAALGKFVVECHYVTDDGNEYVYELIDASISYKVTFQNYSEFLDYTKGISPYEIMLDGRSTVKLQHTLLAGQTGSGKSVMLLFLVLQMVNKSVPYHLYFADAKGSALALLGQILAPERTAVEIPDIVALLEEFVELMTARQAEMQERLSGNITGDYSSFGLSPYVFIFEEYGAVASILEKGDKKTRDSVKSLLHSVILLGRQLGFFMILVCQQPSAQTINTDLRENLPLKILLNPMEQQTKVTTFGPGVDIPNRHYLVGEGVFTEPTLAPVPKLIQCPFYEFDIVEALSKSRAGVV